MPIYGENLIDEKRNGQMATTSMSFVNYLCMVTKPLSAGYYKIRCFYKWSNDLAENVFFTRLRIDGSDILIHQQKITLKNPMFLAYRNLTAGIHKISLDFKNEFGGYSYIDDSVIQLWRVY